MLLDREMEIKNKMRSHYTTIRISHKFLKTNKNSKNSTLEGYGTIESLTHCWWECKMRKLCCKIFVW